MLALSQVTVAVACAYATPGSGTGQFATQVEIDDAVNDTINTIIDNQWVERDE